MTYKFGDLRNYGVSAGTNSVHPIGNPITASAKQGWRYVGSSSQILSPSDIFAPRKCSESRNLLRLAPFGLLFPNVGRNSLFTAAGKPFRNWWMLKWPLFALSFLRGVGNKPYALSNVRSAHGRSRNVLPFCIIPAFGQVAENSAKPSAWLFARATKQCCDVLHDDVLGSYSAKQSDDFGPKARSRAFAHAGLLSCRAEVLAREAAADDINVNSVSAKSVGCECSDIVILPHVGPMLRQHLAAKRVYLAERNRLKPARAFKAEVEPADTCEQRKDFQLAHLSCPSMGTR